MLNGMITETFINFVAGIGLNAVKGGLENKRKEFLVNNEIRVFAERQFKDIYENLPYSSEIDYGGLQEYLNNKFPDKIKVYLFDTDQEKRNKCKVDILNMAYEYSHAINDSKKKLIKEFVDVALSIAWEYYMGKLKNDDKLLHNNTIENILNPILEKLNDIASINSNIENEVSSLNNTFSPNIITASSSLYEIPFHNLPERNPYFSGRNDVLDAIHNQLKFSNEIFIKQIVSGLGGVGKTQVAIEYAYRFFNDYANAVWWFNAETETSIYNDCLEFVEKFVFVNTEKQGMRITASNLCEIFKKWQYDNPNWLFIFDNVNHTEIIEKYIAKNYRGHMLFTSRKQEISGLSIYNSFNIDVFSNDESISFMYERLKDNRDLIKNENDLSILVEYLGCFPLALEQATAYMERTRVDCINYLKLLDKKGFSTLEHQLSMPKTDYKRAVTKTIELSLDFLSKSAQQLFSICVQMWPEKIPLEMIASNASKLPHPLCLEIADEIDANAIVAELLNLSLIKRNENFISIHRFVQEVGRELVKSKNINWLDLSYKIASEKIIAIVAEQMALSVNNITRDTRFRGIGADSLDLFQIISELEELFEIEFEVESAETIRSMGDIITYIQIHSINSSNI